MRYVEIHPHHTLPLFEPEIQTKILQSIEACDALIENYGRQILTLRELQISLLLHDRSNPSVRAAEEESLAPAGETETTPDE